jgi:hypothetical protein
MKIIVRGGVALSVLRDDLDYPYIGNLRPDMICEDLSVFHSDPNTRDIFLLREWGRYNVMTIEDIEEELQEFSDPKVKWRSEEHRKKLFDYYTKVHLIMKTYKREEQINKVLNSNEMQFYLAC